MRFTVPQFIEHESKIIWFLTFKQFVYIGASSLLCGILFLSFGKDNLFLFIILTIVIMSLTLSLVFIRIGGRSLATILGNALKFSASPKKYIWQKKEMMPIKTYKKKKTVSTIKKEEEEQKLPLKIAEGSQIKKLRNRVETK